MALNAYLHIKGQKTGEVKGSVTQKGREGKILVIAAAHEIISPRDPQSGLPTGQRMHKPYLITKEADRASPLLYNMLATNENILEWELQFWSPAVNPHAGAAHEVQSHTVKLVNASIAAIDFRMPNSRNPELARYAEYEEIAFTYQKIIWTWNDGAITAEDDWEARV